MDVWQALREFVIFFLHQERRKLQERADEIAAGTTDKKYVPAAVYVIVSLRAMQAIDFGWLVNKGFAFHHYRAPGHGCTPLPEPSTDSNAEGTAEFVYYCWPGAPEEDMVPHDAMAIEGATLTLTLTGTATLTRPQVPHYATAIEGATGLCFSPDGTEVLLVWERGAWSTPGGAVSAPPNLT